MVTASHNPPEYNGYKVYWGNGAQIIPPHDAGIAACIDAVGALASVPRLEEAEARRQGLRIDLGEEVAEAYLAAIRALSLSSARRADLRLVYTPLHGVGGELALRAFAAFGFTAVETVAEQMAPDMRFPTVRFPNPEEPGALDRALARARETAADLVLANDPDADRLAVAVRRPDGTYRQLSGNQVGALLAAWTMERDRGGDERLVISTIVSTPMVGEMARALGVRYEEVLTGFKWIANRAMDRKRETGARFLFGFEEALGYSIGEVCRDKDGISAAAVFAEMAADAKARGRDVIDELDALYRRFGVYLSRQRSAQMEGATGRERIARILDTFRDRPPRTIGGLQVVRIRDYARRTIRDADGRTIGTLDLPESNVLAFELEGGTRVTARPSGTEPKIKYYFDLREPVADGEPVAEAERRANERLDALARDFLRLAEAASSG
jgi:phosphomannomutase